MSTETFVTIPVTSALAQQLPPHADELAQVLSLGIKGWRVEQALTAYRQGRGTLAYAAEQAGVPLREMILLAYAHGIEPKYDVQVGAQSLSLDDAARL